nr:MAG TPA: hypothetical protein [Caudoviricetes sp.]
MRRAAQGAPCHSSLAVLLDSPSSPRFISLQNTVYPYTF